MDVDAEVCPLEGVRHRRTPISAWRWRQIWVEGRKVEMAQIGIERVDESPVTDSIPLVFLHGWGLSPRLYLGMLDHYHRVTGRPVIAFSMPGFGRSDSLTRSLQNVDGFARHIAAALDTLGIVRADVAGHSFGGGVALHLGAVRPDLVASLNLLCPVGGSGAGRTPPHLLFPRIVLDGMEHWGLRAFAEVRHAIARHPLASLWSALAAWSSDQLADVRTVERLGIPTRVAFADRDGVVPRGAIPSGHYLYVWVDEVVGKHSWMLTDVARGARHLIEWVSAPGAHLPDRAPSA